jgi:hypothetical protein
MHTVELSGLNIFLLWNGDGQSGMWEEIENIWMRTWTIDKRELELGMKKRHSNISVWLRFLDRISRCRSIGESDTKHGDWVIGLNNVNSNRGSFEWEPMKEAIIYPQSVMYTSICIKFDEVCACARAISAMTPLWSMPSELIFEQFSMIHNLKWITDNPMMIQWELNENSQTIFNFHFFQKIHSFCFLSSHICLLFSTDLSSTYPHPNFQLSQKFNFILIRLKIVKLSIRH